MSTQPAPADSSDRLQELFRGSFFWIVMVLFATALTAILALNFVRRATVDLAVNELAQQNVYAPYAGSFISEVETERLRQQARDSIPDEYTPLDLNIGREQQGKAQTIFNFIDVIRADPLADHAEKVASLMAIEELTLDEQIVEAIVNLTANEYVLVKDDVLRIIEESMQEEIHENELEIFRQNAKHQISFFLNVAQERVVTGIAPQLIVANTFFNEEATQKKRDEAEQAVKPYERTVAEGSLLIQEGEVVSDGDIELLTHFGLLETEWDWTRLLSLGVASLLGAILIFSYWQRFAYKKTLTTQQLLYFCLMVLSFTFAAKILVPGYTTLSYLFPSSAMAILLSVLFDARLSMVTTIVVAMLIGYISSNSLEMVVYNSMGALLAVVVLKDTHRINAFFHAGTIAALINMAVIVVFHLTTSIESLGFLRLLAIAFVNGLMSAGLTLAILYFVDNTLSLTITVLKLQELSRLDHPLLQELLRRAPGTYHHSIMVANLAEQAAEKVGANATLVRVGAFYHDIGKMNRPPFFTENQVGINPHDSLDPYSSARIIISHVTDGVKLAKKHRLPQQIIDFIAEHHGTGLVQGFYHKAVSTADGDETQVDESRFRYEGPRPQSRETGIVMLADTVDATSNALRPDTESAIVKLVNKMVDGHLQDGQLDGTELTLGDIQLIRESFINTLKGRYHVRVRYPGNEELEEPVEQAEDVVNAGTHPLPSFTPTSQSPSITNIR